MSTKPRELDIDLNRMRAEKIDQLRSLMRDLDDLDAVERVLNGQTHQIAMTASLTIMNGNGNGNGANGHSKLLEAAERLMGEEPGPRTKRAKPYRKVRLSVETVITQLRAVLSKQPQQAKDLLAAIHERFDPPYAAQSTFNRALIVMREQKEIIKYEPIGAQYPAYMLRGGAAPATAEKKNTGGVKRGTKRGRYKSNGGKADPNAVSTGVLRVLADGDTAGMTIPEITKILEHDGHTEFLREHARNAQVSWALKGHRERHRIKTIMKPGGIRVHQLIRPQITVTKDPAADAPQISE